MTPKYLTFSPREPYARCAPPFSTSAPAALNTPAQVFGAPPPSYSCLPDDSQVSRPTLGPLAPGSPSRSLHSPLQSAHARARAHSPSPRCLCTAATAPKTGNRARHPSHEHHPNRARYKRRRVHDNSRAEEHPNRTGAHPPRAPLPSTALDIPAPHPFLARSRCPFRSTRGQRSPSRPRTPRK